jgi:nucleotide-binding universal stress UspA family protein
MTTRPSTTEKDMMAVEHGARPVVVGVDGTDDALNAARWAAAVAARLGAPLHLVHVMRSVDEALLVLTAPEQEDAGAYPRELGQGVLDRVVDAVHAELPGLQISRTLSHRTPREALTELSQRARMVVLACADVSPGGAVLVRFHHTRRGHPLGLPGGRLAGRSARSDRPARRRRHRRGSDLPCCAGEGIRTG